MNKLEDFANVLKTDLILEGNLVRYWIDILIEIRGGLVLSSVRLAPSTFEEPSTFEDVWLLPVDIYFRHFDLYAKAESKIIIEYEYNYDYDNNYLAQATKVNVCP